MLLVLIVGFTLWCFLAFGIIRRLVGRKPPSQHPFFWAFLIGIAIFMVYW